MVVFSGFLQQNVFDFGKRCTVRRQIVAVRAPKGADNIDRCFGKQFGQMGKLGGNVSADHFKGCAVVPVVGSVSHCDAYRLKGQMFQSV